MFRVDFLPQKGVRSAQFIPPPEELPEGWTAAFIPLNVLAMPYWGTGEVSQVARKDFLVTHINAFVTTGFGTNDYEGNIMLTLFHNHHSKQLQLSEKAMLYAANFGNGSQPYQLKVPYLVPAGDQLTLQAATMMQPPSTLLPVPIAQLGAYCAYFTLIGGMPRGE